MYFLKFLWGASGNASRSPKGSAEHILGTAGLYYAHNFLSYLIKETWDFYTGAQL